MLFFLTVFCGIFGAYMLTDTLYNALISFLAKRKVGKCRKTRKNT